MAGEAIGLGTELQVGDGGSPETFAPIARLTSIGEISMDADDVDVTAYDSPDGFREYIRGLVDAGEIPFTGIWTADATQQAAFTDILGGPGQANKNYKVVFPGSLGEFACSGYIKSVGLNPQLDNRIEFSGTIKVSGKPTFTVTP